MAKAPKKPKQPRKPRPFDNSKWTLDSLTRRKWLINQLRRLSLKYPPAIEAKNKTKETYFIKSKKGKDMKRVKFTCESCNTKDLKTTQMNLDHINPVVGEEGFNDWNHFIDGLFCSRENLWYICEDPCHKEKTAKENVNRTESDSSNFRKKRKK